MNIRQFLVIKILLIIAKIINDFSTYHQFNPRVYIRIKYLAVILGHPVYTYTVYTYTLIHILNHKK